MRFGVLLLVSGALMVTLLTGAATAARSPAVINHTDPIISPDGRFVAFTAARGRAARGELMLMKLAGRTTRVLSKVQPGRLPGWSPDGRFIAFVNKEIYVVSPNGGRPKQLTHEWQADGNGPTEGLSLIRWIDPSTIEYEVDDCCFVGGVSFSYTATVTLSGKQVDHQDEADCTSQPAGCGPGSVLTPLGVRDAEEVEAPDGSSHVQLSGPDIATVDLGAGAEPEWSPHNRYLSWQRLEGSSYDLTVIADPNGANQHALTFAGARLDLPQWSPDGNTVVADGTIDGKRELVLGAADGTNLRVVAIESGPGSDELGGYFSPHGRWILFTSANGKTIRTFALRADGTHRHRLVQWKTAYTGTASFDTGITPLAWSADETTAVYADHLKGCRGTAIYRVDAVSGKSLRLTNACAATRSR